MAVNGWLAFAQQVEIGSIEDVDHTRHCNLPSLSFEPLYAKTLVKQ
jgi:hypothetical protein